MPWLNIVDLFADYVWLCELDEKKGLNIGQTYRTAIKCREFTDAISEVERRNLEKSVGELNFVSIMCDEATDSAVMEQLDYLYQVRMWFNYLCHGNLRMLYS